MYLKFITSNGKVIRYAEVKKRIVIGITRDYGLFPDKKITIKVEKKQINITHEIKLLHDILKNDFKGNLTKFEEIYSKANIYVSNTQLQSHNILIVFGSTYIDIYTKQFYNITIINGNVLLQNAIPTEKPYYYSIS